MRSTVLSTTEEAMVETPGNSRLSRHRRRQARLTTLRSFPVSYFHIDIADVRADEDKFHLFVAVDRTTNCAFGRRVMCRDQGLPRQVAAAVPYQSTPY